MVDTKRIGLWILFVAVWVFLSSFDRPYNLESISTTIAAMLVGVLLWAFAGWVLKPKKK